MFSAKPELSQPTTPGLAPSGFYELRVSPFLARHAVILSLYLIAIGSFRIVATYPVLSLTTDEPGHFACGLEYLQKHVYQFESQHPPLGRMMAALLPYIDGTRLRGGPQRDQEGVDVIVHAPYPRRTVSLMRLGMLPFFWLACAVVFLWARRGFGAPVAVIATALFTMTPPVLAHAGLATTDMALTACLGAAFYSLVLWASSPTWKHSLLLGVCAAAAALSKFTALAYLPAATLLALISYLLVKRPGRRELAGLIRARIATFPLAVMTGAFVVWCGYWFSYGYVPALELSLPAPEFFDGISVATHHNSEGHPAFLLGSVSFEGWWYFFPVVLAVKTPIPLLLLLYPGLWLCIRHRRRLALLTPVAFSLGILLTAMIGRVNIGVRHILPVYIGFAIVAAAALAYLARTTQGKPLAALLVVWMALSGAVRHPDYLAYFNEFVWSHPERVLVDSDLDWGQDVIRLSKRLRELGATRVAFNIDPPYPHLYGLPTCVGINPASATETWTVVRPTHATYTSRVMPIKAWYADLEPTERVGAFLLYQSRLP